MRGSLVLYILRATFEPKCIIHMHRVLYAMLMSVKLVMVGVIPRWSPIADPNLAMLHRILYLALSHVAVLLMRPHGTNLHGHT